MPGSRTSTQLTSTTESRFPVAVLVLRGELTTGTAPIARDAMLRALTEQPTALVVDLDEVVCDVPSALAMFGAVSRYAARWPSCLVILCCGRPDLADHLRAVAATPVLEISPTRMAAIQAASRRPVPPRCQMACEVDADAPARARRLAAATFRRWTLPEDLIAGALLVVSELVTNAVTHARTRSELTLQLTGRHLHIAVRDGSHRPPLRQRNRDFDQGGGRGLGIVGQFAAAWGVLTDPDGKVVWAQLRLNH